MAPRRCAGLTLLLVAACSSREPVTTPTDCPSYLVTLDAAASGFSELGEYRQDAVCASYCAEGYPVCQLVTASSVKCQRGCA